SPLAAADLTLVANSSLTLAPGADLEQQGSLSHPADNLILGTAATPGSGNGALIRLSSDRTATTVRAGVDTATSPTLTVGDNVSFSGTSLVIDSTGTTSFSSSTKLSNRVLALSLSSGRISLQLDPNITLAANPGMVLPTVVLNTLQASLQSFS